MHDETVAVYRRAIQALPKNLLIHFSYADYLEQQNLIKEARAVFDGLLEQEEHPLVYIQLMRFAQRALVRIA